MLSFKYHMKIFGLENKFQLEQQLGMSGMGRLKARIGQDGTYWPLTEIHANMN